MVLVGHVMSLHLSHLSTSRRSKVKESQLADGLDIEDDDVITDTPFSMAQPLGPGPGPGQGPGQGLGPGPSQPSARVFVEKNSE